MAGKSRGACSRRTSERITDQRTSHRSAPVCSALSLKQRHCSLLPCPSLVGYSEDAYVTLRHPPRLFAEASIFESRNDSYFVDCDQPPLAASLVPTIVYSRPPSTSRLRLMPRKVVPSAVTAPVPPPPPSPIIQRLRQDWRWAGVSQFIHTFSDAFGLSDWGIEVSCPLCRSAMPLNSAYLFSFLSNAMWSSPLQALEKDFDGTEQAMVPDLIAKLLYALTWNRQIK